MDQVVEVQVGEQRSVAKFLLGEIECQRGDYVIMEVDRGLEFGRVVSEVTPGKETRTDGAQGKVLRVATDQDLMQIETNRNKAKEALETCQKKITERKLDMQIVKSEYTFDGSKVIIFFTAEGRVDFRSLVKDLARIFKVRIELKQIGVRDKSKIIGGVGVCGRALCCSSYMKGFHPLSIKMPKEQGLPLNPSRISGVCGRIKCCMAYEYVVYREYTKDLPKLGEKITTEQGKGKVVEVNILKRYVQVNLGEGKIAKIFYDQKNET